MAVRKEVLEDIDYLDQLKDIKNPKERKKVLDFLNSFLEETVIVNFKHKGKHIYTPEEQKQFGRENNYRNLDLYGKLKAMHALNYSGTIDTMTFLNKELQDLTPSDVEDALITGMALKNNQELIDGEITDEYLAKVQTDYNHKIDVDNLTKEKSFKRKRKRTSA